MLQLFRIKTYGNLLVLLAENLHCPYAFDRTEAIFEIIHILAKLTVGFLPALHRYKQCRCIAEITQSFHSYHTCRKFQPDSIHAGLEFIPERSGILHIIVKFDEHDKGPGRNPAVGLRLIDLLIGKYIILYRFENLILYLLHGSAGIYGPHHTLPDGEVGKFILVHNLQRIYTESYQHRRKKYDLFAELHTHDHDRRSFDRRLIFIIGTRHDLSV